MLEIDRLTVRSGGGTVVRAASLRVPSGSILGIAGGTAAARTSVLLALAGHEACEGDVFVDGQEPAVTGVLTRDHTLIGSLTAFENVVVSLFAAGGPLPGDRGRIETLLTDLHLPEPSWHNLIENLSGGQQQRVALARALIVPRGFVCLDDPVSELDPASTLAARARIRAAAGGGYTIVTTAQGPDDETSCDEILRL